MKHDILIGFIIVFMLGYSFVYPEVPQGDSFVFVQLRYGNTISGALAGTPWDDRSEAMISGGCCPDGLK